MTGTHRARRTGRGSRAELATRGVVVLGLAVDAYVHLTMAPVMQLAAPGGMGAGFLFRAQAVAAVLAALLLLVTGRRWAYVLAGLVALSALGPVLLYHFVNVPALGPIPSMYDPLWSPEKVVSIVAEALALVFAVVGVRLTATAAGPARSR